MKYSFFLFALVFSTFAGSNSRAGILGKSFYLEPFLAHKTENTKLTNYSSITSEVKTSTPSLGLKLGFRSLSGIEVNLYGEWTQGKAEVTGLTEKNDFSKNSSGFQLGVNSMGFVKMYLGASLTNEFKIKQSSQINEVALSGPSYHAGLVLKTIPYFDIGLQYTLNQYDKIAGQDYTLGDSIDLYYSKIDTQDYSVVISYQF